MRLVKTNGPYRAEYWSRHVIWELALIANMLRRTRS